SARPLAAFTVSARATNRASNLGENALSAPSSRQTNSQTSASGEKLNLSTAQCGHTVLLKRGGHAARSASNNCGLSVARCVCCVGVNPPHGDSHEWWRKAGVPAVEICLPFSWRAVRRDPHKRCAGATLGAAGPEQAATRHARRAYQCQHDRDRL